jgi:hypothetical protein
MEKEKALEVVSLVKSKRPADCVQAVLIKVENYINSQESFSYQNTMKFIEVQMSGKLGGIYGYTNTALKFLKNELKSEFRKSKQTQND